MKPSHGIVSAAMVVTVITIGIAQDWLTNFRVWVYNHTHGNQIAPPLDPAIAKAPYSGSDPATAGIDTSGITSGTHFGKQPIPL